MWKLWGEATEMPYCTKCGRKIPQDADFCPYCGAPVMTTVKASLEFGDWGERFVAWLIDIIVILLFLTPFRCYFRGINIFNFCRVSIITLPSLSIEIDGITLFLYWTILEGIFGQSLGKMIMKLKIVQTNGERITMLQAAVESLGKAFLLPIDCLIGWILYSNKKQRLFNFLSETVVIKVHY